MILSSEEMEEIYKKLLEVREIYHKAYPQGYYLDICITNKYISVNNLYGGDDKENPVRFRRKINEENK